MRYFITFACYGCHLHGDESGSVDRRHNLVGGRRLEADQRRASSNRQRMTQAPYLLDRDAQQVILEAIREVSEHRGWNLLAAHVRTNHVHAIVEAEVRPEKILNDWKAYASRALSLPGRDALDRKRWARHGSTRWLRTDEEVRHAVRYVVEEQGEPLAVFVSGDL